MLREETPPARPMSASPPGSRRSRVATPSLPRRAVDPNSEMITFKRRLSFDGLELGPIASGASRQEPRLDRVAAYDVHLRPWLAR
jgi:hypothetical protein